LIALAKSHSVIAKASKVETSLPPFWLLLYHVKMHVLQPYSSAYLQHTRARGYSHIKLDVQIYDFIHVEKTREEHTIFDQLKRIDS
jgi:hypothetical protein